MKFLGKFYTATFKCTKRSQLHTTHFTTTTFFLVPKFYSAKKEQQLECSKYLEWCKNKTLSQYIDWQIFQFAIVNFPWTAIDLYISLKLHDKIDFILLSTSIKYYPMFLVVTSWHVKQFEFLDRDCMHINTGPPKKNWINFQIRELDTTLCIITWTFPKVQYTFHSPQVKRKLISSIRDLIHELSNDLRVVLTRFQDFMGTHPSVTCPPQK